MIRILNNFRISAINQIKKSIEFDGMHCSKACLFYPIYASVFASHCRLFKDFLSKPNNKEFHRCKECIDLYDKDKM